MSYVSTTCSLFCPMLCCLFLPESEFILHLGLCIFFVVFVFFVENKYFWGHLGGSIGVWAQLIFYGFQTWVSLVSLSPGFGGWGRKSQAPIG